MISVFLADDHRLMRDGLRSVLNEANDIDVVGEADNGRDTVKDVKRLQPAVVIMDVAMPDLNGVDATRQICDAGVNVKILALSMHDDAQYVRGMLKAGASGYVLKDCAAEELVTAIRTVIGNRVYLSPAITGIVVGDYIDKLSDEDELGPELSKREREVLQLIAEGNSTAQIGERIHLSVKTVETHRKRIMDKLEIRNVAELTKYAIRMGLTTLD